MRNKLTPKLYLPPLTITHAFYLVFLGGNQARTETFKKAKIRTVFKGEIQNKMRQNITYKRKQLHK